MFPFGKSKFQNQLTAFEEVSVNNTFEPILNPPVFEKINPAFGRGVIVIVFIEVDVHPFALVIIKVILYVPGTGILSV